MNATVRPEVDAYTQYALSQTANWLPRWLDQVSVALKNLEATEPGLMERKALNAARLEADRHRESLVEAYRAELESCTRPEQSGAGQGGKARVSFDELELMGDDQVQETVEFARLQQVVEMTLEDLDAELNARMCSALGLQQVSPDANPLRSAAFIGALSRAMKADRVEASVRGRWLKAGSAALGEQLAGVFLLLIEKLDENGVKPVGFGVTRPFAASRSGASSVSGPRSRRGESSMLKPGERGMPGDPLLTLDQLHRLLVGNLGADESGGEVPQVNQAMVRNLASEVVTLMMRQITDDKRILQPIRDILHGMKPALIDLARADPRFFADRHNPARRLLDAIIERSLGFKSEAESGYAPFAAEIRGIQRALLRAGDDVPERFPGLLERLQQFSSRAIETSQEARGLAVNTLVRVEQRNLLAERLVHEFRDLKDFSKAPGVVRRFLTGPWAQVVAQARLEEGVRPPLLPADAASRRYFEVIVDLLWSCQVGLASLNRPRLVKVIPVILRTLREGLDSIDYPRAATEGFFQALMGLHEAAYKTQRPGVPEDNPPSRQDMEDVSMWMQSQEAKDTGFMTDLPPDTQPPAYENTQPLPPGELPDAQMPDTRPMESRLPVEFTVGAWFEMPLEGVTTRCQITWASPHGTLYLFNTVSGKSVSMTRRNLDRLIDQDRLRMIARQSVVDDALDAVAQQALQNSSSPDKT